MFSQGVNAEHCVGQSQPVGMGDDRGLDVSVLS